MYYLQSRYYDPVVGRFINADEIIYLLSNTEIIDYNLIVYCNNNLPNLLDKDGQCSRPTQVFTDITARPHQLFHSKNYAAYLFAVNYYNISLYIRFEISALIYMLSKGNKLYYAFTPYIIGEPHSCAPLDGKKYIKSGGILLGAIHTHPNSNSFSQADKNFAKSRSISIYVVTPNEDIRIYHDTHSGYKDQVIFHRVKRRSLSENEKKDLVNKYKSKWRDHLKENCNFNCKYLRWPSW